jgi:hypothetical protein
MPKMPKVPKMPKLSGLPKMPGLPKFVGAGFIPANSACLWRDRNSETSDFLRGEDG